MVDMTTYWPIILVLGVGTFLIRFSFILIMDTVTLPDAVLRMLRFIPASVLTAMIVPAVLLHKSGAATSGSWERTGAAAVALAVAWKTKNIFITIGAGMATLWLLKAVM